MGVERQMRDWQMNGLQLQLQRLTLTLSSIGGASASRGQLRQECHNHIPASCVCLPPCRKMAVAAQSEPALALP